MMEWKLILQIVGVALGLLYLYLEYKANIWLWIVGIIMPIVHGTLYFRSGLYADCAMQVYYILAGLYGLAVWRKKSLSKNQGHHSADICTTPTKIWPTICALYVALHAAIYILLIKFTDSTILGFNDYGSMYSRLLDAITQICRTMARMACCGCNHSRIIHI